MEGTKEALDYELNKAECDKILAATDWLFCLDHNHFGRTKSMAAKLADILK